VFINDIGASTIPSIYVTLASAARRVTITKPTTTNNASSASEHDSKAIATPTISPVQVVPSTADTAAAVAASAPVNDWTEEVMIKRDGATIHIFVRQAGRVIRVALIIISLFYMGYIIVASQTASNGGSGAVTVSMHIIASLRTHFIAIFTQLTNARLMSSIISLVITGIMVAGTCVLLYQKLVPSISPDHASLLLSLISINIIVNSTINGSRIIRSYGTRSRCTITTNRCTRSISCGIICWHYYCHGTYYASEYHSYSASLL
jgi:hypothetical protein